MSSFETRSSALPIEFVRTLYSDEIVSPTGKIIFPRLKEAHYSVIERMVQILSHEDRERADDHLRTENPFGYFNNHSHTHIGSVANTTTFLLDRFKREEPYPPSEDNNQHYLKALIPAWLHDIGNQKRRNGHNKESVLLLPKYFEEYDIEDPLFRAIALTIFLHDGSASSKITDFSRIPSIFGNDLTPGYEMIAADKLDIHRRRIAPKIQNGECLDPDNVLNHSPHTIIPLYVEKSEIDIENKKRLQWDIIFDNNTPTRENTQYLKPFHWKEHHNRLKVPSAWYKMMRENGIPYATSYTSHMMRLYATEFGILMNSLSQIAPNLEEVVLSIHDESEEVNQKITHFLKKESWDRLVYNYWRQHFRNEHENRKPSISDVPPILRKGHLAWLSEHERTKVNEELAIQEELKQQEEKKLRTQFDHLMMQIAQ